MRSMSIVIGAALALAACNTMDAVDAPLTTETFTGTILASGGAVFPFTVSQTGTVTVTLTTLAPQTSITMGLGVGTPTLGGCSLFAGIENAQVNGPAVSGTADPGNYCVDLYDLGNVQGSDTYTITVSHP